MSDSKRPAIIPYESDDGAIHLDVQLEHDTIWLTQEQMAELFGVGRPAITKHIGNIYESGELDLSTTSSKMEQVVDNRPRYLVTIYNLDMVISVGYRVNSAIAVKFRKWATQLLKDYMIKGFVLDDARLSRGALGYASSDYFDELVERVRKIRVSESMFYQKVKQVFSETSVDYDPSSEAAKKFYATLQNKFHYAVTGMTAAEIVTTRIGSNKPNAGLTHIKGNQPTISEAKVAKNYMLQTELRQLYLISEQFLSFAELTVETRRTMTMADWSTRFDNMLKLNDLNVLTGSGRVSHRQMEKKVKDELAKYKQFKELSTGEQGAERN